MAEQEIARLQEKLVTWLDEQDEYSQEEALVGLAPEPDPTTKRLDRYEAIFKRDYKKSEDELTRVRKEGEAKSNGTVIRLRPWDVDPLIRRIKDIERPPALTAEIEALIPPALRVGDPIPVANVPGTAAVIQDPQPVVARTPAPPTVTPVAETKSEVPPASPAPTAVAPSTPAAQPEPVAPESTAVTTSTVPPAP